MIAEELWKQYLQDEKLENVEYEAWQFGESADKLADLVVKGIKTATCSLYYWYQDGKEKAPVEGDYGVILNSENEAICIVKTTKVYILPYCNVSEEHAYKEDEGDRSLKYWRMAHEEFFSKELAEVGKKFQDNMEVVCEEFELVYIAN